MSCCNFCHEVKCWRRAAGGGWGDHLPAGAAAGRDGVDDAVRMRAGWCYRLFSRKKPQCLRKTSSASPGCERQVAHSGQQGGFSAGQRIIDAAIGSGNHGSHGICGIHGERDDPRHSTSDARVVAFTLPQTLSQTLSTPLCFSMHSICPDRQS